MWSAILSDANEIRKADWAPGRAAGVGESGMGLPLTSQRSQTRLLGPVYSQLPKPWSPGKAEPTSFLGHHPRPCPEGRTAASAQGRTHPPHPCPAQGLPGSPPSPGARGTRRDGGGQVRALPESQLPLLSTWDRTLPSAPSQICSWSSPSPSHHPVPGGTGCQAICIQDQNADGKLQRRCSWPQLADEKTKLTK